jgi:hypothetical protein
MTDMGTSTAGATAGVTGAGSTASPARLSYVQLGIVGVAMGVVSLFTVLAWIPAILTGMVIGRSAVERSRGVSTSATTQVVRVLAVTGGVLAMLFLGAIIGGLIAFLVAAGASFAERIAADASPTDQTIARILVTLLTVGVWFLMLYVFRFNFSLNIGG